MTAARVPLPHWRTESRPCRHPTPAPAVHSPVYLTAFAFAFAGFPNKRLIAVEKFERNLKDHLSMFLKLRFHVLRCRRNNTFLRAFVNTLSFFGLRQATQCQRLYSTPATHAPVLVADRSGRPSPLPSAVAHTDWPRAEAPRCRPQLVPRTLSGNVSYCRGPVRGEKQQTFYKCTQKCIISFAPRDTKPEFRGHGKEVFHIVLEFSGCDEPFVRKSSENGQIGRAVDSRRWPGMTTRSTLRTPVAERDPCCSHSAR